MISKNTVLISIDNSGVGAVKCIHVYRKGKNNLKALVGDTIRVSVKSLRKSIPKKKAKKSDVLICLIVVCRHHIINKYGLSYKNCVNNIVILNQDKDGIISNRILKPISSLIRETPFSKLVSLAPKII